MFLFSAGRPSSRKTGTLVLLGTVCVIIFMVMTFVNYSHQERKFSMLESWMKSHTSDLTSVKSDFQSTGGDLEKKVAELQTLVSSLSSYLNTSGPSNPMTKEHQQTVSHTEVKSLMDSLSSTVSDLMETLMRERLSSSLNQHNLMSIARSLMNLWHYMGETRSSIQSLSYKLSFANLLTTGCIEHEWIPFSNSCYLFSQDALNWTEAIDYCEEQGALLLKIEDDSKKEWQFVTNMAKPHKYWIGLTDQQTGQWRWADDSPYTMNKAQWVPGEPNNLTRHGQEGEEGEDCGEITVNGLLNDAFCSNKIKFICKMKK
ncbi:asialoglycoprotein receptor 2 [Garra rufa]|uniref:asialoglycoprotein receptor 2 n=1 Tax=Garra rufa TaxID=137080 RepID=UPI003CCE7577